jgi:hypothetical protein
VTVAALFNHNTGPKRLGAQPVPGENSVRNLEKRARSGNFLGIPQIFFPDRDEFGLSVFVARGKIEDSR